MASQHRHLTVIQTQGLEYVAHNMDTLISVTKPIRVGRRTVKRIRAHLKHCKQCRDALGIYDDDEDVFPVDECYRDWDPPNTLKRDRRGEMPVPEGSDIP